jgi:hypothetical protein
VDKTVDTAQEHSDGYIHVDSLLKHIQWRLAMRKFCVVSKNDLDRVWPLRRRNIEKRVEAIHAFAKANNMSAVIHDSGLRVTFRKLPAPDGENFHTEPAPTPRIGFNQIAGRVQNFDARRLLKQ